MAKLSNKQNISIITPYLLTLINELSPTQGSFSFEDILVWCEGHGITVTESLKRDILILLAELKQSDAIIQPHRCRRVFKSIWVRPPKTHTIYIS